MTDPISRASKVMAECSEVFGNQKMLSITCPALKFSIGS